MLSRPGCQDTTGVFGSKADRRGSLSKQNQSSLLLCVLSLWNIKLAMCGQLIRDTALLTSDHRGVNSTRRDFSSAVPFIIIFCCCGFRLGADFVPFRFVCKHHKSQQSFATSLLHLSNSDVVKQALECCCCGSYN